MREFRIYQSPVIGYMKTTMEGDPRQLALDIANAMQHNRVVAATLLAAVAKYMRSNNIDFSKFQDAENIPTFIAPGEAQQGEASTLRGITGPDELKG
jgi:hypothetical protein